MNINEEVLSYFQDNILIEARVKDVKAKYPTWNKVGWINQARAVIEDNLGPRGVSKYLLYWTKAMEANFQLETGENEYEDNSTQDYSEISEVVLDLIFKFQQNQDRMEEKDIYKYNISQLQQAMDKLGLSSRKKKQKKKEEAIEGSEIVWDDDEMFAVRPYDENASCYYGKSTRWCISATESHNYFDQYTRDGKAFVMVRMENLPEDHDNRRIALVYDIDGDFDEAYDAPDEAIGWNEVKRAVAQNHKRTGQNEYDELDEEEQEEIDNLTRNLIEAGSENVQMNPPDPTENFEEKIQELEDEYSHKITHAYYNAEVDNHAEGNYMYFSGGFQIQIDNSKFEGGKYDMPSGWRAESELNGKIDSLLQGINVWAEEVEFQDYNGITEFNIRIGSNDYEPSPDGYERFLDDLKNYDDNYPAMIRVIEKYLAEEEYIGPIEFDRFKDQDLEEFGRSLKNFTYHVEEDIGDETIAFESDVSVVPGRRGALDTLKLIPGVERFQQYTTSGPGMQKYNSKELNNMVVLRLKTLHQKVVKYLEKQLELPIPNLPPRVIKELTIPEMFNIVLLTPRGQQSEKNSQGLAFMVDLEIDDVKVTPEVVKAVMDVIKFVDSSFELVRSTVIDVINELYDSSVQEGGERMEHLSDFSKQIISLARHTKDKDRRLIRMVQEIEDYQFQKSSEEQKNKANYLTAVLGRVLGVLQELGIAPESEFMSDAKLYKPEHAKEYFPDTRPGWSAVDAPAMELSQTLEESTGLRKNCFVRVLNETNSEIEKYFSGRVDEESERSRQKGIYRFWCMLGYSLDTERSRGLDDILAEIRAIPSVTIVTVAVRNRKIGDNIYIAGLSVKFVPSYPGIFRSPEDAKSKILTSIRQVSGVNRIFKISTSFERVE